MRHRPLLLIPVIFAAVAAGASVALRSAGLPLDEARARQSGVATSQPAPATDASASTAGVREAAWSPDSKRLAVSRFDAIWTLTPDGRDARRLVPKPGDWITERDPDWALDGKAIAFSASTNGQFDLWTAPAAGGAATRVTSMPGDERWPSWTRDGRLVFSHREPRGVWQLFVTPVAGASAPARLTPDEAAEWQGRVSPDGRKLVMISDRDPQGTDDSDVWVRAMPDANGQAGSATSVRVTNAPGAESFPVWAPDNARVAYAAVRAGGQNGVWVSVVPAADAALPGARGAGGGRGGRGGAAPTGPPGLAGPSGPGGLAGLSGPAGLPGPVLASRHLGAPSWSPDGQTLAIATFPTGGAGYNGNPNRNDDDPPAALAGASQYALWRVAAPRAVDEGATALALAAPDAGRWTTAFDAVWQTLKTMYYAAGPSATAWDALRQTYRPEATRAKDAASAEDVIDRMVSEQPLIKPGIVSRRAVVASGSPLASDAGALVLEQGGNVVDAGIAVALALGVVEPDATSLGGDGQAILFLKGMSEPVVIEYKDMTPGHATADNPKIFTANGGRVANDGPTVANIPGVVAGLDLLYQKYGSKRVAWADLVAPAIKLADEGFVLDEALPTSIAEGRAAFAKYPESAKLFLPGGRLPKPGDRFVNKDYAETLRTLAKEGGSSFYRGSIAQKIAADMAANGGVITLDDLGQYRAMERKPVSGKFHGHLVYSVPAPVSNGAQMVETLNILDNYPPRPGATIATDADYLHYAIEAWRVRDGGGRIADPERWPVDYGNHLDPAHALERFALIDPKKVYVAQGGGRGGGLPLSATDVFQTEDESGRVQTGTTAFVVADAEGNMIAFTQTLSTWGGNYYVSKGLGFLYNDHFRGGGGRGGGFGSMLPLMRSSSTSVPTLVFRPSANGAGASGVPGFTPRVAVGCAGNAWIPASVYSIILNVVDGGLTAQRAIEAPRMLIGGGAGGRSNVQIEDRIPRTLLADLEARGHTFQKVGRKGEVKYGYAAVAVVDAATGTVQAGADPRRSHGTAGPIR
jgi:gamma-glutamyltranspeptidase